jgi:hypothetical protein
MLEKPLFASKSQAAPAVLEELARRIVAEYGAGLEWLDFKQLLGDRSLLGVRCELRFDDAPLLPGECAHLAPMGLGSDEAVLLYLHPSFASQLNAVPFLALPHVGRLVTQGKASPEEAERFGAAVMGTTPEAYYDHLCDLASQLGGDDLC